MRRIIIVLLFLADAVICQVQAQTPANPRPITLAEYDKAKLYKVNDLDNDTYAKFDNNYILDRYEKRKPYFITGDDGLKKRMDLYKLMAKEGMQELGTMIYYTNEKGKLYTALQPNFTADGKVWEKYFEDIHSIDKEEKNFVLKLSYILSREMSFQLYKAMNNGKEIKEESGTYGSDICFPGNQLVAMAGGTQKMLSEIKAGDKVVVVDPKTNKPAVVTVNKLVKHEAKNYAITKLLLLSAKEQLTAEGNQINLSSKVIAATPNHPMITLSGKTEMGRVAIGEQIVCLNEKSNTYQTFTVYQKTEAAAGLQNVYNIEVSAGTTFIMNSVMVLQK